MMKDFVIDDDGIFPYEHRYIYGTHQFILPGLCLFSTEGLDPSITVGIGFIPLEVAAWCIEHFGTPGILSRTQVGQIGVSFVPEPHRWASTQGGGICIMDDADAFAFKMRWG